MTLVPRIIAAFLLAAVALAGQDSKHLPNFQVVKDQILRGGQPTDDGFRNLARRGVNTIVDLRPASEHSVPREKEIVEGYGMRFVSVPMKGLGAPTGEQISRVLNIMEDSDSWPVFVHCRRGSDRTGTVVACYRISHDQWLNRKAFEEAKSYGFSFFERGMRNFIERFRPALP